ncbi:hypothetical protein ACQ4PT_024539 [Festuca glaucescens]
MRLLVAVAVAGPHGGLHLHRGRGGRSQEEQWCGQLGGVPYVACIAIVGDVVDVVVDALRAHVCDGTNERVAKVHGLVEDPPHPKVGDLDKACDVNEEVGGLDVAVHDVEAVEVGDPVEVAGNVWADSGALRVEEGEGVAAGQLGRRRCPGTAASGG